MAVLKVDSIFMLVILCLYSFHVSAQKKETGDGKVVWLPEFYHYQPVTVNDTTWKYECYNHNNKVINVDELIDIDSVDIISFSMSYYQYPKKGNSPISPPYLQQKLYVYARNDDGTWRRRAVISGQKTGLKEDKNKIIRSDTVMVKNHATGLMQPVIHRYYTVFVVDIKTVKAHEE